ncbi:hypothetical protein [Spirosoma sp. KNUC1025]|uniref:hypothetical protein n=1 Tax=Spirosoma sp. KNUC1025 TaxID=2894082 RepID=UPI003869DEF5|nr:hypothetical protein LN737_21485 [Spirosoma sp. KNUC1025]
METPAKPLRGMDVIRRLLAVKKQVQQEAVENYRNNSEVRAIYERLIQKNKENRFGAK